MENFTVITEVSEAPADKKHIESELYRIFSKPA